MIWDITTIAWIVDTEGRILQDSLEHRPIPEYDHHYGYDCHRPFMKYVWNISRDALFEDLFARLTK